MNSTDFTESFVCFDESIAWNYNVVVHWTCLIILSFVSSIFRLINLTSMYQKYWRDVLHMIYYFAGCDVIEGCFCWVVAVLNLLQLSDSQARTTVDLESCSIGHRKWVCVDKQRMRSSAGETRDQHVFSWRIRLPELNFRSRDRCPCVRRA